MSYLLGPDGMQAGWLETPSGKLFSCYHQPQGERARAAAVLLCDPFGNDPDVFYSKAYFRADNAAGPVWSRYE